MRRTRSGSLGRVDRMVVGRGPRWAPVLLGLLVAAAAAATTLLPTAPPAGLLPAVLAAVLAGLWCGPAGRLLVPLLAAAALLPLVAAMPGAPQQAAVAAAALALLVCTHVVSRCAAVSAAARLSAVQATVAREDDVRAAAQSQQELAGQLHYWSTHDALTGLQRRVGRRWPRHGSGCAACAGPGRARR